MALVSIRLLAADIRSLLVAVALAVAPAQLFAQTVDRTPQDAVADPAVEDPIKGPETRREELDRLFLELASARGEEAEAVADRIREIWARSGSDSMDLLLKRARSAMNAKAFDKARSHLSALTRLAPDFAEGWNASATLYYLEEDFWRSAEDIRRTLALEPRHFSALAGLALVLERTGRKDAALRTWREVEKIYPDLDKATEAIDRLSPEVDGRAL